MKPRLTMARLEPVWIDDLMGIWVANEAGEATAGMGYATVCPSFAKVSGTVAEAEDVGGYSNMEISALAAAYTRLEQEFPQEARALQARFRPWLGVAGLLDDASAASGAKRLAEWVDATMESV